MDLLANGAPKQTVERMFAIQKAGIGATYQGRYHHWARLKHLSPPEGLSVEDWWLGTKMARKAMERVLPLTLADGQPFRYCTPDPALELLHFIDGHASGEVAVPELMNQDEGVKRRYIVGSLIEEAIRSSQLEGAAVTRQVAKEMIRTGREPRTRDERMILNNYRAMEFIREDDAAALTPEHILQLHRILTEGTLDDPKDAGRIQGPNEERVAIVDPRNEEVRFYPPPAEQLSGRLDSLCRFANGEANPDGFLHPVVRAILLHFQLAYDHPFVDGNGRTARALFYWSMRHAGYWLVEYLSISRILRMAPARYARSFEYVESDEGDSTYFILHHLEALRRAIDDLHTYLSRKMREVRNFERLLREGVEFNYRQVSLLQNALQNDAQQYTFESHARSHRVSWQTARADLLDLHAQGLLVKRKRGRRFVFFSAPEIREKLRGDLP